MGLFDSLFSGKQGRLAAMQTAQQLANTQNQITGLLNTGQNQAIGAIQGAQPLALSAVETGYNTAMPQLQTGYDTARADYGRAADLYNPYAQTGQEAFKTLAGSLGLGGGSGREAALAAFRASPAYEWQRDESLEGVLRKQGAMGMAQSGGTLTALQDRASHLADAEYRTWLQQLQGIASTGYNATNAQAGLARGQGDLATGYGQDAAKTAYQYGQNVGDVYRNDAARMAQTYGNTTALGVGALTNLGKLEAENANSGMLAGQKGSANALATLLKLGEMGTGLFSSLYGTKKVA
jgi:hypothetical protein